MHLDGRRIPMFTCKFIEDKVTGVEVNNWRENCLARIFVESFSKLLAGHYWTFFLFRKNLPKPFSNQINSSRWLIQAHLISHWHQLRPFLAENIFLIRNWTWYWVISQEMCAVKLFQNAVDGYLINWSVLTFQMRS